MMFIKKDHFFDLRPISHPQKLTARDGSFCRKLGYFTEQTRMDQRGDHMKMNFDYLQIKKSMLQTEWKKETKKWGNLSSFHVSFLSYGP